MADKTGGAKGEELRIELLRDTKAFKFKKLANSGLGMRPIDGKQDISLAEFMLLRAVDGNSVDNPSNVSPTDIGQFLSVTKGAVSQMLNSLEEKGFISRALSRENRRNTLVLLTPKGRELLGDEENEFNAKLDALIETMGRKDIEELIAIVERLTEVLDSPADSRNEPESACLCREAPFSQ